jgi:hypothetical protein
MSVKSMSKANARQGMHNKARYDRYRASAVREKNQLRRLMRHLNTKNIEWSVGSPTYLIEVPKTFDPKQTISQAWAICVDKTGAAFARELIAQYKN